MTTHLKEEHYDIDDRGEFYIDWAKHTVYVRARFLISYRHKGGDMQYLISDWSPIAATERTTNPLKFPTNLSRQ